LIKPLSHIAVAFALSTILTGLFVRAYGGYASKEIMLLSGSIAGGKWTIQILAGFFLLDNRRWIYIRQLADTCLIGSLVLLPFAIFSDGATFFFGSLLACILVMSVHIVLRMESAGFSWRWPALWLALLCIAVGLQLTVVFHLI